MKKGVTDIFFLNGAIVVTPFFGGYLIVVMETAVKIGQGGKTCINGNIQDGQLRAVEKLAGFLQSNAV